MDETEKNSDQPEIAAQPNVEETPTSGAPQEPSQIRQEPPPISSPEPESAPPGEPVPSPSQTRPPPEPISVPPSQSSHAPQELPSTSVDFRTLVREGARKKREARLERLLTFVREKQKVTNSEIRKKLGVSDATATRYASELIRRGLVKKSGRTKSTYYEPI